MFKKFIGDRKFYKMVLTLGLPIMIQNGISNFVNLLDNIMVGSVGTEQMSGVAVANQFMFVFNLCVFGAISGAGIFSSQFFGKRDHEGIRYCFRFKLLSVLLLSAVAVMIFIFFQDPLISQYLKGNAEQGDPAMVLQCGKEYITVMLWGLLPFGLTQMYSGTLREQNQTLVPMVAGLTAVAVNLGFNWLLIFGNCGFPELGIRGAAIATVISRFVELAIVVLYTHLHRERYPFIVGAYRSMRIPAKLCRDMIIKGTPLLLNEGLWSAGVAILSQRYSLCGLIVVGAQNISNTVSTFFNMIYMSFGTAISIVVGPLLGRGESEKAVDTARKMITFCVMVSLGVGATIALCAPLFPKLYNVTPEVRDLARRLLIVTGCCSPINAFVHASYFTIRSGGKTGITFLFDSAFMWCVVIPTATILVNFTSITIIPLFLTVSLMEGIKCIVAYFLIKKRIWIKKLVD